MRSEVCVVRCQPSPFNPHPSFSPHSVLPTDTWILPTDTWILPTATWMLDKFLVTPGRAPIFAGVMLRPFPPIRVLPPMSTLPPQTVDPSPPSPPPPLSLCESCRSELMSDDLPAAVSGEWCVLVARRARGASRAIRAGLAADRGGLIGRRHLCLARRPPSSAAASSDQHSATPSPPPPASRPHLPPPSVPRCPARVPG